MDRRSFPEISSASLRDHATSERVDTIWEQIYAELPLATRRREAATVS